MEKPKLTFIYAFPLDRGRRALVESKGKEYPNQDIVFEKARSWQELWDKEDARCGFLQRLVDIIGSLPERSLECFVIGGGLTPMSTPFIIPVLGKDGYRTDEQFIETTIHELIHIFVSHGHREYWDMVREKYSDESLSTQNHIIVYAILEKIYKEVFNGVPGDYDRDDMPEGYQRAIEIVKEIGYEELVKEFQNS